MMSVYSSTISRVTCCLKRLNSFPSRLRSQRSMSLFLFFLETRCPTQQHIHRTRAAVRERRRGEGQHQATEATVTQPDAHLFLQHRTIVFGVEPPAMNEQDTPLPGPIGRGQKTVHDDFGLFNGMAMQVDMCLDGIIATVQALRQTPIHPWRDAFHILICVLNRKRPAPFYEVP